MEVEIADDQGNVLASYASPTLDIVQSHQVDFNLYAQVCALLLAVFILMLLVSKKPIAENIHSVVIIIFEAYGVAVCLNVISITLTRLIPFGFTWFPVEQHAQIKLPPAADEHVLILIGAVTVGLILASHIGNTYLALLPAFRLKMSAFFQLVRRSRNQTSNAAHTHSSTPPTTKDAPPTP